MEKKILLTILFLNNILIINGCCFNNDNFDTTKQTSELIRPADFPEQEFISANQAYQSYQTSYCETIKKMAQITSEYTKCVNRNLLAIETKLREDKSINAPQDDCINTFFSKMAKLKEASSNLIDYERDNPRFNPSALIPEEPVQ